MKRKFPPLKVLCWTYFICTTLHYLFLFHAPSYSPMALLGFDGPFSFLFLAMVLVKHHLLPAHNATAYIWLALDVVLIVLFVVSLILACFKKYKPFGIVAAIGTGITLLAEFLAGILNRLNWELFQDFIPGMILNTAFCVLYFLSLQENNRSSQT